MGESRVGIPVGAVIYCSRFLRVLLPGGATWFNQSDGYADAGRHIYDVAIEMNERGNYFPVWGTCLGFELLTYLSADGNEHRAHCSSNNQALPLVFKEDFRSSRLFANAPEATLKILEGEAVTSNFHQYCVTEKVKIILALLYCRRACSRYEIYETSRT